MKKIPLLILISFLAFSGFICSKPTGSRDFDNPYDPLSDEYLGPDNEAPVFSGIINAVTISDTRIDISWSHASDTHTAQNEIIYYIYRSESSGTQIFSTPTYTSEPGAITFSATDLIPGTRYYFVVRARDKKDQIDTNTVEATDITDFTPSGEARFNQAYFNKAYY